MADDIPIGDRLKALRAQRGNRPMPMGQSPDVMAAAAPAQAEGSTVESVKDVGRGIAKGAGSTAVNLGRMIHNLPGIGSMTDALAKAVGPAGTDPNATFAQPAGGRGTLLEATNGAQELGKTAEQIGEFFVPGGPAKGALIERLVKMIPDATPAMQMKLLNKVAALVGRAGGEAASAAGVSMAHGEENPELEAMTAGAGPLIGAGMSSAVNVLKTPLGEALVPYLGAAGVLKLLRNITPGGLAGVMGAFGLAKAGTKAAISSPMARRTLQRGAESGALFGGRMAAGTLDQMRAGRRRLPVEVP